MHHVIWWGGWWFTWVGGRERLYTYIWLIHFFVQQKLTQHCKAIISNNKIKTLKAKSLTASQGGSVVKNLPARKETQV